MSVQGYFFNAVKNGNIYDRTYNAEDFTKYLDKVISNGVFMIPSTSLQVVANNGMSVAVKSGQGWIDGHKIINTADYILEVDNADVVLNRIDRVVFYADYQSREMGIKIIKGANAVTPVAPALTRDTNTYEMCLAEITILKQTTSITQSVITDTRANNNICGWGTGLVREVDTSTLFTQWQTAYEEANKKYTTSLDNLLKDSKNKSDTQLEASKGEFDNAISFYQNQAETQLKAIEDEFKNIKANLTVPKLTEYKTEYTTTTANETAINIGVSNYVVDIDIIQVYVNGFRLMDSEFTKTQSKVTLRTPLSVIGTQVEIIVIKSVVQTNL